MNREWEVKLLIQRSKAEDTKYLMRWQKDFGNISFIEQTNWPTPYGIPHAIISEKSVANFWLSAQLLERASGGVLG